MGKVLAEISPELQEWLLRQPMFFVSTAPLARDGHVNCSPKSGEGFRLLSPRVAAYRDLTGSGVETIAHLRENGRIVLLFCAFDGPPQLVRLHGRGEAILPDDPDFRTLAPLFPPHRGTRAIIRIHLDRISRSCGFTVPKMQFVAARDQLDRWCDAKDDAAIGAYRAEKNAASIDGLPGVPPRLS